MLPWESHTMGKAQWRGHGGRRREEKKEEGMRGPGCRVQVTAGEGVLPQVTPRTAAMHCPNRHSTSSLDRSSTPAARKPLWKVSRLICSLRTIAWLGTCGEEGESNTN
jgi:hypothetical protein